MRLQLTLALRYLNGRKLRSFLTTLAIMFGVLVVFGLNTILPSLISGFEANALAASGQTDVTITGKTGGAFSADLVGEVAALDGVRVVSGSLERVANLPADFFDADPTTPDAVTALALVGIDPETARAMKIYQMKAGRFLQPEDQAVTVISQSLADVAGVGLNEVLTIPSPTGAVDLMVVGILPQRLIPGIEEVLVTLPEAQRLLDMPGQINVIDANFESVDRARREAIQGEIESSLGPGFKIGAISASAEILSNLRFGVLMINVIGVLGLLMGAFIIFNTFRTVVAERRRDIGMLRAVGASRQTISGVVLMEGAIQGGIGTFFGLLFGYGLAVIILHGLSSLYAGFLNAQIPAPTVSVGLLLGSIILGVGITLLAGWLPARSAARVPPLEALRPSVAPVSIRGLAGFGFWSGVVLVGLAVAALVSGNSGLMALGSILFVTGLALLAPALIQPVAVLFGWLMAALFARNGTAELAEGNLSRQPGRAAVTASTTMIAMAILVMATSLMTSVFAGFTNVMRKSLGSDFLLVPPSIALWRSDVGASPELADRLRAVEGVQVVSSLRFASTEINDTPVSLLGIVPRDYTQTSGLTFSEGDPGTAYRALESGRNIILNGMGASTLGVEPGDTIALLTPTGEESYEVVGIATDYLNAKLASGYISQPNMATDFLHTEDVFLQADLAPGADNAAVAATFRRILKQYPQFKLVSGEAYYQQNIGIFNAVFVGMYALVIFLAIPSLIAMLNTLAIGVLERTREIGMLRAVGATRRQVRTIIVAEALILAAIGTAFGLLAGLYLGYMTVAAMQSIGYPTVYSFPASGIVAGVAIGLLFGALAAIIPARQAARMDVVSALRYE
jgi:putative ABC transport system permease protein